MARDRLRLDMNRERDRKYVGRAKAVFRRDIPRCKKYAAENAGRGKRRARVCVGLHRARRGAWARLIWLLVAVVAMHGAARRPTRLLSGSTKGGEGGRELSKEGIHSLSLSLVGRCSSYSRGFQPHNSRCGGGGRGAQLNLLAERGLIMI